MRSPHPSPHKRPNRPYLLAGIYATLFLIILYLAYSGNLPSQLSLIPYYDKPGHLILYGVATYLGHRLLHNFRVRYRGIHLPLWILAFSAWTLIEEGGQYFAQHRTFDGLDIVFSFFGIGVGYWLAERDLRRPLSNVKKGDDSLCQ